jgi:hypothetical protein
MYVELRMMLQICELIQQPGSVGRPLSRLYAGIAALVAPKAEAAIVNPAQESTGGHLFIIQHGGHKEDGRQRKEEGTGPCTGSQRCWQVDDSSRSGLSFHIEQLESCPSAVSTG